MRNKLIAKIRSAAGWREWILMILIVIGVFLRTYHFQELLVFASDQARDLKLVTSVVDEHAPWPLLGPAMTGGEGFRLGPIYYYFQIISAKIFGVSPVSQAYPDLLFSILSILLLYYFFKRYFSANASLLATGIYTVSYFAIEYSRFAWNVNLIPFFVLLFLLSFGEFLIGGEKARWRWVALAGLSLGIGVQLHAILLLLLPAVAFFGFTFLLLNNRQAWPKVATILLIALMINFGQFVNEQQTGFANTKNFLNAFFFKSDRTSSSIIKSLELDVACNAQANIHILSSLGNKNLCDFLYGNVSSTTYNTRITLDRNPLSLLGKLASLLFLVLGYVLTVLYFRSETDIKKKYFLGLLILYGTLYFLIMIPIAPGSRMRYFLPIIFLPFVFLCFLFDFLAKKYPHKYVWTVGAILIFLLIANINSIRLKLKNSQCNKSIQANNDCSVFLK